MVSLPHIYIVPFLVPLLCDLYNDRMKVKVLFFASMKDVTGQSSIEVGLDDAATVADLIRRLQGFYPKLTPRAGALMTAVNSEYVTRSEVLHDGDEVALIPPVSGGNSMLAF